MINHTIISQVTITKVECYIELKVDLEGTY